MPVAGKDGKTGQTFIKTVLAPAFRARSLYVEGWFSTNILGNRDGLALDNADSLRSKLSTKGNVLEDILGYPVEDHLVNIQYYKPRGDNKEAWDNIDLVGFMGQKMQMKVNFLCRDSILAAPLVIEIARVLDLAKQRGKGGIQEQLGIFFKAPMTPPGRREEHSFPVQERKPAGTGWPPPDGWRLAGRRAGIADPASRRVGRSEANPGRVVTGQPGGAGVPAGLGAVGGGRGCGGGSALHDRRCAGGSAPGWD